MLLATRPPILVRWALRKTRKLISRSTGVALMFILAAAASFFDQPSIPGRVVAWLLVVMNLAALAITLGPCIFAIRILGLSRQRWSSRIRGLLRSRQVQIDLLRHELDASHESYKEAMESLVTANDAAVESLMRSNQELDDFAYVASHDLKEPLRGIHNYSTFVLEDYGDHLDEDGRAKLETLTQLTQRLETLIDSLLHYSRVGRTELAIETTSLDEVLKGVIETLQVTLEEKGVKLSIPRTLPAVRCDRARIGEVFRNLITNAIKYNQSPEPQVEIGYFSAAEWDARRIQSGRLGEAGGEKGARNIFYVRDNGIGIRKKHHESIFRIFKRLHGRNKYGGGTGAGLTIVKKIVSRHGGKIWVESGHRKGSTFYFTLDGEQADESLQTELCNHFAG